MVRRLARHVIDGYGSDRALTRLVDSTELWFVPVANPDGYDHSFTPGNRLWRKNLRDNNGDGRANVGDGVDLNRNFPTKWSYDDEGASAAPASETFRGPRPASEPETRALDRLMRRVGFEFLLSYHSTGSQLLYGTAWQVDTPTPDDVVYEALAGDDAESAVPGYDPDLFADLGVGNGDIGGARPRRPRHARVRTRDVVVCGGERVRSGRRVRAGRVPLTVRVSRRREARRRGVRQERPVRARRGAIDPRPGRPGLGRRPSDARVRGRRVRRVLRRPADRRRHRAPGPAPPAAQLPDRRRPRPPRAGDRVARRRALRRRARRLLRRVPREGAGRSPGRPGRGVVHARREPRATTSRTRRSPPRAPRP